MKKCIAIACFAALLLSTSSLSYFYLLQEKLHETERFAMIDVSQMGEKEHDSDDNIGDQIKLVLKDKTILPQGYHWEEKGREFSYKGMFYDIVSIFLRYLFYPVLLVYFVLHRNLSHKAGQLLPNQNGYLHSVLMPLHNLPNKPPKKALLVTRALQ